MISVQEAQEKILARVPVGAKEKKALAQATGCVLADEILSPLDLPSFDNSAMDGYALRARETQGASPESPVVLTVPDTITAGKVPKRELKEKEAFRIFTGAMIPPGADTIAIQEEVTREQDQIFLDHPISIGKHIRQRGEEVTSGGKVFEKGTPLTPAALGLIASMGLTEAPVFRPPRVGILVTGSEIITHKNQLGPGQIYDSNSFSLTAALSEIPLAPSYLGHASDEKEILAQALAEGLESSDFLIVTGGVSVGDYDFVKEVASEQGIEGIFWKVKQKPGKPIYFGCKGEGQFLFGLPGNPASALVCFYEYVRPAILRAMGHPAPFLPRLWVPLKKDFKKKEGRAHFLKGYLPLKAKELSVEILGGQGSHMMKSFAHSNCLIYIPEEKCEIPGGELVEVHLLPNSAFQGG